MPALSRDKIKSIMKRILVLATAATLALCAFFKADGQTVIESNVGVNVHYQRLADGSYLVHRIVYNTLTGEIIQYSTELIQVSRRVLA